MQLNMLFQKNLSLRKTNYLEKKHFLVTKYWEKLTKSSESNEGLNMYKGKIKKHFLGRMKNRESHIYT